ncbi:MAG TPA: O-antigen ligase family protein [Bacteroidia bacterium]|nr:O-antigen ligase family protein [Bacteroidia bacterium]
MPGSLFLFKDIKTSAKHGTVIYYSILAYIVSLFIKNIPVISNGLMILILVFAIINTSRKNYFKQFGKEKVNIGIILFFVFQLLSVFFSSDKSSGFNILSLRVPLLIFPLAFCLIDFDQKIWKSILFFYVFATIIASMVGFLYGSYLARLENNTAYFYNDNISELLLGKQAAYFGLYINVAILAIVYLLKENKDKAKPGNILLFISIFWLLFINYMLASKMSTLSLVVILISALFINIIRKKKVLEGFILVFGVLIAIVILDNVFPKTIDRFKTVTQTGFSFENTNAENSLDTRFDSAKWSSGSTRMALWTCGREIFVKHPIFGTGLGDIRNSLKEKYADKHFEYALNTNKNLHCQYFDIAVSMGAVGLLLFLFLFFAYPIKVFISNRQDFAVSVFICVGLCLLTENMFDRLQGEQIIAFILPLSVKIFDVKEEALIDYQPDTY